ERSGKTLSEHRFFRIRPTPGAGYRRNRRAPAAFFEHEKGIDLTDQRGADQRSSNSGPRLKRNDRFIFGAVIFVAYRRAVALYDPPARGAHQSGRSGFRPRNASRSGRKEIGS